VGKFHAKEQSRKEEETGFGGAVAADTVGTLCQSLIVGMRGSFSLQARKNALAKAPRLIAWVMALELKNV